MNRTSLVVGMVASLGMVGCYSHTYNAPDVTAQAVPSVDSWHHHVLFGLADISGAYNLREVCPTGVARIHSRNGFLNYVVSFLTFSIYTPTTVTIWCAADASGAEYPVHLVLPQGTWTTDESEIEFVGAWEAVEPLVEGVEASK